LIKTYTSELPRELARRVAQAAEKVRPHVRGLIEYIKFFSTFQEGSEVDVVGLIESVTNFVGSSLLLFCECRSASMMDELSLSMTEVNKNLNIVGTKVDSDVPEQELSSCVYMLNDSLLKLIFLLSSRLVDIAGKDDDVCGNIAGLLTIFDSVTSRLTLLPKNELKEECVRMTDLMNQVRDIRPTIEQLVLGHVDYERIITAIYQHINNIIVENEMDPEQNMQIMVQLISELSLEIEQLAPLVFQPYKQPTRWSESCAGIVDGIESFLKKINSLSTSNHNFNEALKIYAKTLARILTQLKLLCCSYGLGISIISYEHINFTSMLKDFAFLITPIFVHLKGNH